MREMKNSGVDWIGEIPQEWLIKRVKNGFTRKNEKAQQNDPVILSLARAGVRVRDLSNNEGQIAESYYNYNPVEVGDLLLNPMDLYSGANCSVSKVQGVISPAYINLCANKGYNSAYYDYYFKTLYWAMTMFAHGKGVSFDNRWTLGVDTLFNLSIPYPKYIEQCNIVNFLDRKCSEIDTVLEKTRASIEKYKKLKQSIITQAVTKGIRGDRPMKDSGIEWIGEIPKGWECKPVKYIATFQPSCDMSALTEKSEITYTPMDAIKNGYFIPNTALYGTIATSLTPYQNGDIVMAKVTPCFENGNIALMENLSSGFGLGSSELFVYRPYDILPKYLMYWLQNDLFRDQACATMTGTGGLKRVSPYFAKNCPILLPCKNEQEEIVKYLEEKCEKLKKLIDKKESFISELEAYKKSLIYEYVTGKKEVPHGTV